MQTISSTEFNVEVSRYLREHHTVTLSTSSFTGLPHANTAPYVSDDRRMYFFARYGSTLLSNLARSHRAAFTVDDYAPTWQKRRELHGRGTCGIADDLQSQVARKLCTEKFENSVPAGTICWLEPSGMYFVDYTI